MTTAGSPTVGSAETRPTNAETLADPTSRTLMAVLSVDRLDADSDLAALVQRECQTARISVLRAVIGGCRLRCGGTWPRPHVPPVFPDRASPPPDPHGAAVLGSREPQTVAERPEERPLGIGLHLPPSPVDDES